MLKKTVVFFLFLCFLSCGRKGPLKPPYDVSLEKERPVIENVVIPPPKNLHFEIYENIGVVKIFFTGEDCSSFKIYRYQKGRKKSSKPYGETKESSFIDNFPILKIPVIYEVSCVQNGRESENNPVVEVIFQ